MANQLSVLFEAVKRVPVMAFALGVAGLATVVGTIYSIGSNFWVTIIGIGIILVFMTILILLSRAAFQKEPPLVYSEMADDDDDGGADNYSQGRSGTSRANKSDWSKMERSGHTWSSTPKSKSFGGQPIPIRTPVVVFLWGAVILFLVSGGLFVSCVFFKKPTDLSSWFKDGGGPNDDRGDHRDYTLYLQDKLNSQPIDLNEKDLLLRVYGVGDLGFDRATNGTYRFRPFTSKEDSGTLIITGEQEWMFENKLFEKKIALNHKNVTALLVKNPDMLMLAGVILRKNVPVNNAVVSTRVNGTTIIDTTNILGEFELHLPDNTRDRTFSLDLVYKLNKKTTIRENFSSMANRNIKYLMIK
jgi:hypothetical protein